MLHLLREDYSFKFPLLFIARYSFLQPSELWRRGEVKKTPSFEAAERGFEHRFSRLRIRHSTAEIPCSSVVVSTVSKIGHVRSLHDAPVHSTV